MSKTDKTRPVYLKGQEHPVEEHDHRNGVCEIAGVDPKRLNINSPLWGWSSTECRFTNQWWRPEFRCGCSMCDGSAYGDGPEQKNRQARRKARQEAKSFDLEEW